MVIVDGYRLSANLIWKGKESKLENKGKFYPKPANFAKMLEIPTIQV